MGPTTPGRASWQHQPYPTPHHMEDHDMHHHYRLTRRGWTALTVFCCTVSAVLGVTVTRVGWWQ